MRHRGVITTYAVFGAAAQMRYTQAVVTIDLDVLVAIPHGNDLNILGPIYEFCQSKGYHPEGEAIRVGAWPVQFIPAFDELSQEAMVHAEHADLDGEVVRVVSADYLAAIALKAGRPKDMARILGLLEAEAVSSDQMDEIASKHGLVKEWHKFKKRFMDEA
jgi:hypothetical protein